MTTRIITWLLCILMLPGISSAVTAVGPSDPNILYTGRWDDSSPDQPWSYWIGSSLIAEFEGTSIEVTMGAGESGRADYLRVIIDGDAAGSVKIPVAATAATYSLASGLADAVHRVEIVKETDIGRWTVHSLGLDDGKSLAPAPARPARRIVFFGDSNLAGYSLQSEQNQGDDELRGSYRGYAGVASRMLGAEYQNISRSGATISSIHGVYDQIDYGSSTPTWDFNRFPADLVVVNAGANDVGRPEHRIKDDYNAFLDDLRTVFPDAHIMLFNAWGWDYDEPADYIHEVIAERGDPAMSSAVFPWIFEQWHGCEYDHAGMAQVLADHLTATLGWAQNPSDVLCGYALYGDLANGGFEETAPFGGYGWRYYTDAGVDRIHDPNGTKDGEFHLRLADGASVHQPFPAGDGKTFTVGAWLRGAVSGDQIDLTLDFRDQEMWTTPLQSDTETISLTTQWQRYTLTATAPVGTANPVFHARVTFAAAAGSIVDIDGAALGEASAVSDPAPRPSAGSLTVSPNPFNPAVELRFRLPAAGPVHLAVYDLSGRRVAVLADDQCPAGEFVRRWSGRNDYGREVGSGTYFARLVGEGYSATRKMVLLR